jgi:hypothetical protein
MTRQKTVFALSLLTICTLELSYSAGAQEGTFVTFDPPGSTGTEVTSVNPPGVITGYYFEGNSSHGFVRSQNGTITSFDGPGAAFTNPESINPEGAITGYCSNSAQHGFLRSSDGTIITVDPPARRLRARQASILRVRLRDITMTRAARSTVSCGLKTAPSPLSILRDRGAPTPKASTLRGRSRDITVM